MVSDKDHLATYLVDLSIWVRCHEDDVRSDEIEPSTCGLANSGNVKILQRIHAQDIWKPSQEGDCISIFSEVGNLQIWES